MISSPDRLRFTLRFSRGPLPFLSLVLAFGATGCSERESDPPSFVVSDSAGIRIVTNERPSWRPSEGWTISAEPTTEIGVQEGDERFQFADILGVRRLSDGRLVVLDAGSAQLRFFDSGGNFLMSVGGPGQGPGEFNRLTGLLRMRGDTLVVSMLGDLAASWFTSDGDFVRTDRLDNVRLSQLGKVWSCPERPGLLPDATYLACVGRGSERNQHPEAPRASHLLVRTSYDVSWADTLGTFYGFNPPLALSARSTNVAAGGDPLRIFLGDPAFYEIDVVADHAGPIMSIRYPNGLRPVGEQERSAYAAYVEERRSSPPSISPALARERALGGVVSEMETPEIFPATLPGFTELHYDALGYLWAVEYTPPWEDRASALVFSDEGVLLGPVELPAEFQIEEIGADYVLGVWRNEFDVEFVRMYALSRPPRS